MSGTAPSARGSCHSTPPWAAFSDRSSAPAKTGLRVSGQASELPFAYRLTVSTPAATNACPSPALIAWNAIRIVCSEDAQ